MKRAKRILAGGAAFLTIPLVFSFISPDGFGPWLREFLILVCVVASLVGAIAGVVVPAFYALTGHWPWEDK